MYRCYSLIISYIKCIRVSNSLTVMKVRSKEKEYVPKDKQRHLPFMFNFVLSKNKSNVIGGKC